MPARIHWRARRALSAADVGRLRAGTRWFARALRDTAPLRTGALRASVRVRLTAAGAFDYAARARYLWYGDVAGGRGAWARAQARRLKQLMRARRL